MRYTEEVQLLQEEMRRVLAFLQWQANWWREQGNRRSHAPIALDSEEAEGLLAYAERQAALRLLLHDRFKHMWRFVEDWVQLGEVDGLNGLDDVEEDDGDVVI
jgi:hypothetical protein